MTPETAHKRILFESFIDDVLATETAVRGIVGIGPIANGTMQPHTAIHAVIFLAPFHPHFVPAHAMWDSESGALYNLITNSHARQRHEIALNFVRLNWQEWRDPDFHWPEPRRAELAHGWIAYDPDNAVHQLIRQRTTFTDATRQRRLDQAIIQLHAILDEDELEANWQQQIPVLAHDRLQAAYEFLVQAIFAYNRHWRPGRSHELDTMLTLEWLPENFQDRALTAANPPGLDYFGYMTRAEKLHVMFHELLIQLMADGAYSQAPVADAYQRLYDEPAVAQTADAWTPQWQSAASFA